MISERPARVIERLSQFLNSSLDEIVCRRLTEDPQQAALRLFHSTVDGVPAYRRFLEANAVRAEQVSSFEDFQRLPLITKTNYMQVYPLSDRCQGGSLTTCDRLSVSSGSTGTPTFWPRSMFNELDIALRFEQIFRCSFHAHCHSTLAVVCFPLGNWVGGLYTASCCWLLAQKGYPITVATPGNKPDEILRVIRELSPQFEQTVLLGYPPFVKDVIDTGATQGIDWPHSRVRFVFAGEVYSEEWRALMGERVGSESPCYDSASLYGTADGGVLGNETPVSIAIRRFLAEHPPAARALFGESRLPTLVQYDPLSRFFEVIDGNLLLTGDNGVPLVRYHIADRGGILSYDRMMRFLEDWGISSLAVYGLGETDPPYPLPFVWVFGRADFTVSFYSANIYPENIVVGLEQPEIRGWVSGKFVMETCKDADGSAYLQIAVELLPNIASNPSLVNAVAAAIKNQLLRLNSEFAHYTPAARQLPQVLLCSFGDTEYFPGGVKHRYTRR